MTIHENARYQTDIMCIDKPIQTIAKAMPLMATICILHPAGVALPDATPSMGKFDN
jgi:hypothetical protein